MDLSYGILHGTIPERVREGFANKDIWAVFPNKHQVDGTNSRATRPFSPNLQRVAPESPELRSVGSDLKPMVANEDEVVRTSSQPVEVRVGR